MATRTVPTGASAPVLRLTTRQYRRFHALAKREAGAALNVQCFKSLGAWGQFTFMASGVVRNAAAPRDVQQNDEVPCITLASQVNVSKLKATSRPEMDWSAIPEPLIYEFIFWHEVGHRLDNFDPFDLMVSKYRGRPDFAEWQRRFARANEVLADRYAWNRLFPGRPLPVAPRHSAAYLREVNEDIEQLSRDFQKGRYKVRPLPEGVGEYIPMGMLRSPSRVRLAGLPVQSALVVAESNDPAAWHDSFAASQIGPQRPILEVADGAGITYVAPDADADRAQRARLRIGRGCSIHDACSEAGRYGFRSEEVAAFLSGFKVVRPL